MVSSSINNCWDILDCNNLDCLARLEPETPCWEISQRHETYQDFSNTCRDCLVYKLDEKATVLSIKKLQNSKKNGKLLPNTRISHQVCIRSQTLISKNIDRYKYHFLLHDFIEQKVFLDNTWCDQCDEPNLAVFNQTELEIDGSRFTLGYCRICNNKILSEIIEKNVTM